jgi:hypothetical protein
MIDVMVPEEIKVLYEGKLNFIIDRFRGIIEAKMSTGEVFWTLQVMDFGGNICREHKFADRETYVLTAQFLMDCGLELMMT